MSNEQGFWDKLINGPVTVETRSQEPVVPAPTDMPGPGSVLSVGGTSPLPGIVPPARPTMEAVTPEIAMTIGTVFRCVDIITTSVSQMELEVFRDGILIKTPDIVKTPNVNEPASAFVQETVLSLATYGNAYWRTYGDPVASLEVLDPRSVKIDHDERTGKKFYWVGETRLEANKIRHLKHTRVPGSDYGKGPIQFAQEEIRAALLVRKFQNEWFDVSVTPQGYLKTDQRLTPPQRQEAAEQWINFLNGNGRMAVLSEGNEFVNPRIRPAEAQMLDVVAVNDKNIIRIFGVPGLHVAVELGGTSTTYMNMEQSNMLFIQNCLTRYMNEIENNLTDMLPGKQTVKFNETALLRSDTAGKWNVIKTQVEVGYTSGDEMRAAEGKKPLPKPVTPKAVEQKEDNTDGNS